VVGNLLFHEVMKSRTTKVKKPLARLACTHVLSALVKLPPDPESLERAARLFRAMGDAPRLRILHLLLRGETCVGEIVTAMNEKFSTISQRLRILRSEGLVNRRREGSHVYYALADNHVKDLVSNALAHASELDQPLTTQEQEDEQ
jgi:ArsR family transcriptional regulator